MKNNESIQVTINQKTQSHANVLFLRKQIKKSLKWFHLLRFNKIKPGKGFMKTIKSRAFGKDLK